MTIDTNPLQERIEHELEAMFDGGGFNARDMARDLAPIIAAEVQAAKGEAWDEGHSWGWSDAQEAHDTRQVMPRSEWRLCTPNPYRTEQTDD